MHNKTYIFYVFLFTFNIDPFNMKFDDCLEELNGNIDELTKLKNKISCLIDETTINKINKKYIRLLEKKSDLVKCEEKPKSCKKKKHRKHKHDSSIDKCSSSVESSDSCIQDSDKFWKKCKIEDRPILLLKIEKQLCATLSSYRFEKTKCNITSTDSSGTSIGFGEEIYGNYKLSHPNQLYFFDLCIEIQIFNHVIKIVNRSTSEVLTGEYTLYYIDDNQIDSRTFYGNCAQEECTLGKLWKKLKGHKRITCDYDDFLEVLTSIVKIFPKLLGFKETNIAFTEKEECN